MCYIRKNQFIVNNQIIKCIYNHQLNLKCIYNHQLNLKRVYVIPQILIQLPKLPD